MMASYGIVVFAALLSFGQAKFDSSDKDKEGSYFHLMICFSFRNINHLSIYIRIGGL